MNELLIGNTFDIQRLKQDFIDYIDVESDTLKSYSNGIANFALFMQKNSINNPTRKDVMAYRDELRENYASNTVNSYMVALRNFFKFLNSNHLYEDITINVKGAKVSETPKTQVLSANTVYYIYNHLEDNREKAIFGLLITTGLRGIEVANARLEDIQLYNDEIVIFIKCKGHSERDEYSKLSKQVLEDIYNYVGDRRTGYIFTSESNRNKGGKLTTKTIRTIIKGIFRRFGIDIDGVSLHSTRRTSATEAYELGADIKELQQFLHHKNINTTARYINACTRNKSKLEYKLSDAMLGGNSNYGND